MPMTRTFTQNDLIRFIYHETTDEETLEINKVLESDPDLRLAYRQLLLTTTSLDAATLTPSDRATDRILQYVHGLGVKQ